MTPDSRAVEQPPDGEEPPPLPRRPVPEADPEAPPPPGTAARDPHPAGEIPPPRPPWPSPPTGGQGGATDPATAYWCESVARAAGPGGVRRVWLLGRYRASCPHQALCWLLRQAARFTDLLAEPGREPASAWHPTPGHGPDGSSRPVPGRDQRDPARAFRDWLADEECQYTQTAALERGERISVAAIGPDRVFGGQPTDVCYTLLARPRRPRLLVASGGGWFRTVRSGAPSEDADVAPFPVSGAATP